MLGKVFSSDESLFISPNPNPEPSFKPIFYSDIISNVSKEIKSKCNDNVECIYDSVLTNNTSIGKSTLDIDQKNVINMNQLCKSKLYTL